MTIEIIFDPAHIIKPDPQDCVVISTMEYLPAILRIKNALSNKQPLRVWVDDPVCAVWFERLAQSYSTSQVRYAHQTIAQALSQRWNVIVPEELEAQLLTAGLLNSAIVPRSGQSFEDIILENWWGELFAFSQIPLPYLGDLLADLDMDRWQTSQQSPFLRQVLFSRQEKWLQAIHQNDLRVLVKTIFSDPAGLRSRLAQFKILGNYPPDVGKPLLDDWLGIFHKLNLDVSAISLLDPQAEAAQEEIRYYLNSLKDTVNGASALENALAEMSGWLVMEFEWMVKRLKENPQILQNHPQLIVNTARKFRPIQDQVQTGIVALHRLVPPKYPQSPTTNRSEQEWLNWVIQEYLPYHFWLEENDRWDEACASYSAFYADWFYEHYNQLRYQHQEYWVFDLLNHTKDDLNNGHKILFVVIDNFNFKYLPVLVERLRRWSFQHPKPIQPVWSLLPSTTSVSKSCLIAGMLEQVNIEEKNYAAILQDRLGDYSVAYLPKLDSLIQRNTFTENLLFLNYLPVDSTLHKDEKQIGITHTAEIEIFLTTLADEIVQFARRAQVEDKLAVYFTSDHGSTKITPSIPNLVDVKHYKKEAKDPHHRFIIVSEKRAKNPSSYDQQYCYVLPADHFGTHQSYFIPKGYGRFIKTEESLYVHGGLSPEETIVPFGRFIRTKVSVLPPSFRLLDPVVRLSVKTSLAIQIRNPNPDDITSLELRVKESDLLEMVVEKVGAGLSQQIRLPVRIKIRPGIPVPEMLTLEGIFEFQGNPVYLEPVALTITTKSLSEDKTSFDFEF